MEVTKKVTNIMKDAELQKNLASINVNELFNHRVLRKALKLFQNIDECLLQKGDPNPEITLTWLNWTFNSVNREICLREAWKAERNALEKLKKQWPYTWCFHLKAAKTKDSLLPSLTRPKAAK
jgi:hypothetical protein